MRSAVHNEFAVAITSLGARWARVGRSAVSCLWVCLFGQVAFAQVATFTITNATCASEFGLNYSGASPEEVCINAARPYDTGVSCTPRFENTYGIAQSSGSTNFCILYRDQDQVCNGNFVPGSTAMCNLAISTSYTCPPGQTLSQGTCKPSVDPDPNGCGLSKGVTRTGMVPMGTSSSGVVPTVQHGGCTYDLVSSEPCLVGGVRMMCGTWAGTGDRVPVGASMPFTVAAPAAPVPVTGSSSSQTAAADVGQSGGGTGTGAFNSADAANLSRIATNTARTATGVDRLINQMASNASEARQNTGGGGGTGSEVTVAGEVDISGQCGGTGQPKCGVVVDETGAASAAQSGIDATASAHSSMEQAVQGVADGLDLDTFEKFGHTSRWVLNFGPFFQPSGQADCFPRVQLSFLGQQLNYGWDFCPYVATVQGFLSWVFSIFGAIGLWGIIYRD